LLTFQGNRWRLWRDTVEEHDAEVGHYDPNESYTAACWGAVGQAGASPDLRFALGCASGRVQTFDSRSGEALGPTADAFAAVLRGADCAVSAVALARRERGSLFASCYAVADILELGIADGITRSRFRAGKLGVAQLAVGGFGSQEWLLTACPSATLKLWGLPSSKAEEGELLPVQRARLTGPATASTCLGITTVGEKTVALCADGTPQVDVFVCDSATLSSGSKAEAPLTAAFVLSSHEQINSARIVVSSKVAEGRAYVIGWGPRCASLWNLRLDRPRKSGGAARTVAPALVVLASELGGRVLSARMSDLMMQPSTAQGPLSLAVAWGPAANPSFAVVNKPADPSSAVEIQQVSTAGPAAAAVDKKQTNVSKEPAKAPAHLIILHSGVQVGEGE